MTQPTPDSVFVKARDGFLTSLSGPERSAFKNCLSPAELITEVKRFVEKGPQNSRLGSLLGRLKDFSDHLGCYFKAVDIFVQSNPETAAVVWGAIRLVLQVRHCPAIWYRIQLHGLVTVLTHMYLFTVGQ
jgi:hypothetical protein